MPSSGTRRRPETRRSRRTSAWSSSIETARFWRSLGHHDPQGGFRIDGVTGPDEYSAVADNNVYTNLLARRNLLAAADAVARHPRRAAEFGADFEEAATWRDAGEDMVVPWDDDLGVHLQSEGFTRHQRWDFRATDPDRYPLLLHYPYFDLYRKQVVKQADLVLALHVCGDAFTDEEKARDFAYYEALTVRDSSLSAATQAVIAAEVGHLDLAFDYFGEAALLDLHDLHQNTRDGLHIASLAGAWIAAVAGFGGMRDHGGGADVRASSTCTAAAAELPSCLSGEPTASRHHQGRCHVHVARRGRRADQPPRRAHHRRPGRAGDQTEPAGAAAIGAKPAARPRAASTTRRRGPDAGAATHTDDRLRGRLGQPEAVKAATIGVALAGIAQRYARRSGFSRMSAASRDASVGWKEV